MDDVTRGKVPTAFLSSTCYDLKQIRADIKKFFEGKSITNLEYLTAREKHIPIYVFIDKKVLNVMGI